MWLKISLDEVRHYVKEEDKHTSQHLMLAADHYLDKERIYATSNICYCLKKTLGIPEEIPDDQIVDKFLWGVSCRSVFGEPPCV